MATTTARPAGRKRTTLADLIAAAALGAIDPSAEVVTAEEADDEARDAFAAAQAATAAYNAYTATTGTTGTTPLSATDHDCALPGCRHGAAHGLTQPDRQVKLACPNCGAIARMTASALRKAGTLTCGDDGVFVIAPHRAYTRRAGAA